MTPSKAQARMVPADQPETWPFRPGDVVRDSGQDGDDAAWLDAAPQRTVLVDSQGTEWTRLGDGWFASSDAPVRFGRWASYNLNETYGPLSVVSVGEHAPHAARPAAPATPATPAVGAGTSGVGSGAPAGAGEVGIGDALRHIASGLRENILGGWDLRALAERADALEARIERARARAVRMTERRDEKTRRHGIALLHILDGDS